MPKYSTLEKKKINRKRTKKNKKRRNRPINMKMSLINMKKKINGVAFSPKKKQIPKASI